MIDAIGVVDVVEGWSKFLGFDHHLTLRTTACYTVMVFEWSKFFENSNFCLRANILYIMEISLIVMIILGLHYLGNRVAKILPLGKTQIYLVFLSLNRTFGLMPLGTPARKNSNLFGFSLT